MCRVCVCVVCVVCVSVCVCVYVHACVRVSVRASVRLVRTSCSDVFDRNQVMIIFLYILFDPKCNLSQPLRVLYPPNPGLVVIKWANTTVEAAWLRHRTD